MITDGRRSKAGDLTRSAKRRVLNTFDLFVVAVVLGYLLLVVQSVSREGGGPLQFPPWTQLYPEPTPQPERPAGAELTWLQNELFEPVN
jgi:hypothetical protein